MSTVTDSKIDEMVAAIVRAVNPLRIILFGSRARQQASPASDVDLLIIEEKPFGPERSRRKELGRLYRLLAPCGVPHDLLVYSQQEARQWADSKNHIIGRALREGKLVYERS